ncbi:hypothetical protein GW17_00030061 [Ensete ventricosum]|nr:hypothetical protein GW17_00030061 [Ensete ventricosum]
MRSRRNSPESDLLLPSGRRGELDRDDIRLLLRWRRALLRARTPDLLLLLHRHRSPSLSVFLDFPLSDPPTNFYCHVASMGWHLIHCGRKKGRSTFADLSRDRSEVDSVAQIEVVRR